MASRAEEILEERRGVDNDISRDKTKRRYVFDFSWVADRGEKYEGTFVNQIMTSGERADQEAMASRFLSGVPWDSVSPERRHMVMVIAHMEISLEAEGRPKWARNLASIIDEDVILLLYKEVSSHEEIFRRPRSDKEGRTQDG